MDQSVEREYVIIKALFTSGHVKTPLLFRPNSPQLADEFINKRSKNWHHFLTSISFYRIR